MTQGTAPAAAASSSHHGEEEITSTSWRVFGLTWFSYFFYYFARKPFSIAKKSIEERFGIDRVALSWVDTAYNTAYPLGQFLWGILADRVGYKAILVIGTLATATLAAVFGAASYLVSRDHVFTFFLLIWGLNGLAQATGWSPNVKAMTAWFPKKGRGTIMGIWATCYITGSLVANPVAGLYQAYGESHVGKTLGWSFAFWGPATLVAIMGLVLLFALPSKKVSTHDVSPEAMAATHTARRDARAIVLKTPLLWGLGASYFFLKLTRYALFAWLPYFMGKRLGYSTFWAATAPLAFEAGGVVGSTLIGLASDKLLGGKRLGISLVALVALGGSLPLYAYLAPHGLLANMAGLAMVGFFLYGPDTLLSSTSAQDLGGPAAAATAAGVINGVGSFGQILSSYIIARVSLTFGWGVAFTVLGGGAIVSAMILVPFWLRPMPKPASE